MSTCQNCIFDIFGYIKYICKIKLACLFFAFLNVALKYKFMYVAHFILGNSDLASLYPILFSIPSFSREVSEGKEGESVPNSLNIEGGTTAWVTVSYGFRDSH